LIQPKKPVPGAGESAIGAGTGAATGAATGAGAGAGTTRAGGAGVSGSTPLMSGSCLGLAFSRRVMPTSSSGSSIIV
jgi:hypothetical protein